jgi:hypothetical protein
MDQRPTIREITGDPLGVAEYYKSRGFDTSLHSSREVRPGSIVVAVNDEWSATAAIITSPFADWCWSETQRNLIAVQKRLAKNYLQHLVNETVYKLGLRLY